MSISYTGDVRQYIGAEDPHKVEKLVSGAAAQLRALYTPILAAFVHLFEILLKILFKKQ